MRLDDGRRTRGHARRARIDTGLAAVRIKLDALGGTMNQAMGGLRVGAVVWQVLAAAAGFVAAHLWPVGK